MDRNQAAVVHKHLLEAAAALDRTTQAMFKLDKAERQTWADMLFDAHDALHFGLLRALYAEHPELRPADGVPEVSSTLRWEDVVLPERISAEDIDAAIAEALALDWQKTAMVIARALPRCQELATAISTDILGARIVVLVEAGRIDGVGDPRKWRHSEVRLPH